MDEYYSKQVRPVLEGNVYWFAAWPTGDVPKTGSIVYTIWDRTDRFIYVGISGRSHGSGLGQKGGPWNRLNSHASGRRSGDQFNVYVSDRLVLPTLHNRLDEIASGRMSVDAATRDFIRINLGFRWMATESGAESLRIERWLQRGFGVCGKPLLNPLA